LSVEQLFKKVRVGVVEATKGKQTPWESSSLVGDFFFASLATVSAPTASSPVPSPASASPGPVSPDPEATMWTLVEKSTHAGDVKAFLDTYPNGRFAPAARLRLQQLQRLTEQQQAEESKRIAEQERQRREREAAEAQQRAEAQRREEERKRLEEAKWREEQAQKAIPGTVVSPPPPLATLPLPPQHPQEQAQQVGTALATQQPSQVALLEPDNRLRERASVAIPTATLGNQDARRSVPSFRLDTQPVSNRDFLEFVTALPQWKKHQITSNLHDGDYLKHWHEDGTISPEDMDRPVRYVSYYAAAAYCKFKEKKLPRIDHYRIAASCRECNVEYATSYKAPDFNFVSTEWTDTWWGTQGTPDPGKRVQYQHGTIHSSNRSSRDYTPEKEENTTGRRLGFRCAQ